MRLCFVAPEIPPYRHGGIGLNVTILAGGFAARGHQVTVVGFQLHPSAAVRHPWGSSISLEWNWPFLWRYAPIFDPYAHLRAAVAVRRYLRCAGRDFDIVEFPNWGGHACLIPSLRRPAISVRLCTPHLDTVNGRRPRLGDRLVHQAERRTCHSATVLIANSRAMARKAAERYQIPPPDVVIPHGLPDITSPPFRADETVDILFIGRAERRKGLDVLLRALARVAPDHPQLRVTLIGTDLAAFVRGHPELAPISARLLAGTGARLRELGRVDEATKQQALTRADWVVIPSRFESFGLVAIEALRSGTPIIVTTGSGLEEIGHCAPGTQFVRTGDVDHLACALETAVSLGPCHKETAGPALREAFRQHFSADRMVSESEGLFRRIVAC